MAGAPPPGFPYPGSYPGGGSFGPAPTHVPIFPGHTLVRSAVIGPDGHVHLKHGDASPAIPYVPIPHHGKFKGVSLAHFNGSLFALATDYQDHIHYNVMNAQGQWGGWVAHDGASPDRPVAVAFHNKLFVFVRGTDNKIYHRILESSWTPWSAVPGGLSTVSAPAVAVFNNELFVLIRGANNHIYCTQHNGANFGNWYEIPNGGQTLDQPAVAVLGGALHVFVRGTDNRLYTTILALGGQWVPWALVPNSPALSSAPTAYASGTGTLFLYLAGGDQRVYRGVFRPEFGWSQFSHVPAVEPVALPPAVVIA